MAYGKLSVIKTYGSKPTFVLLDRKGKVCYTIPDINDFLLKNVGKMVDVAVTSGRFQISNVITPLGGKWWGGMVA